MSLDEKILQDDFWETKTIRVIAKGETVQVLLEREHKWQGQKFTCCVNMDLTQAAELGNRLIGIVNDHNSAP